jgi:spore maturation protein CgeB
MPSRVRHLFWHYVGWKVGYIIRQEVATYHPDLVLVLKGEMILANTLRTLKNMNNAPRLATWWVDNPLLYDEQVPWPIFPSCVPIYDHVFMFDYAYFASLHELGAKQITFLPCACDPELYHPAPPQVIARSGLQSSVCFIASFYPRRGDLLASMLNIPGLALWGPGWEKYLADTKSQAIFRGSTLPPSSVSVAYQASSIVLNSHHPQTKIAGLNTRAFEAPACGAFQIMDYIPQMESMLTPGKEVVVYRSPSEAASLVRDFVNNRTELQRIAHIGRQRVLEEHTYYHRMKAALSAVGWL